MEYFNLDLVLIQSLRPDISQKTVDTRLLPLRNPYTLPDIDAQIFGDTKDFHLYNIRFSIYLYQIKEPGEHTLEIHNGRLSLDDYTGPDMF